MRKVASGSGLVNEPAEPLARQRVAARCIKALAMILSALLLAAAAAQKPNLVLVTIDTLRADRLRCYGHTTIETPATDRLAREGVLVQDATVQAPQTRPSHASILTGRLPYEHGIRDNYSPPLDARVPTLATILDAQGYRTAAFVASYTLAALSGLDRGFDLYDDPFDEGDRGALFTRAERRARRSWTPPLPG